MGFLMYKGILLFLLITAVVFGQNKSSVHQNHSQEYGKEAIKYNFQKDNRIIMKTQKPDRIVFGFLPYWEYLNGFQDQIRYDLLTHLAVFDYRVDSAGNISAPQGWPWDDVITNANASETKLIMTVTNFDSLEITNLLNNANVKAILIESIKDTLVKNSFDGVAIDFENLKNSDKGQPLVQFMQDLSAVIKNLSSDLEVCFTIPPINWDGHWDISGLANVCDYLFVMGYDFSGSFSQVTAPNAPLTGNFNINMTRSIEQDFGTVVNSNPEKIIMGVPYYGVHWTTDTDSIGSDIKNFIDTPRFRDVVGLLMQHSPLWSVEHKNPYMAFTDTSWNQVWYDDDSSLGLKYDFALQKDLKGIGIWALGYDYGSDLLWNKIEEKFVVSSIESEESFPESFILHQNYPNPFNPVTTISFSIREKSSVKLTVFNLPGEEVAELINDEVAAGTHEVKFNGSDLSSGVYFYRLTVNGSPVNKKMMLVK